MSKTTTNLGLFQYDPETDGSQTFNIDTALNKNWDKVDEADGNNLKQREKGAPGGVASLGEDGKVPESQLPEMDYIPNSQKGAASGVATLDGAGRLEQSEIPNIDCGVWDTTPVAEHNAAAEAHQNLLVDGNNTTAVKESAMLNEHMANPMAHQNLVIDGNAGQ